jgi:hypothetical protein
MLHYFGKLTRRFIMRAPGPTPTQTQGREEPVTLFEFDVEEFPLCLDVSDFQRKGLCQGSVALEWSVMMITAVFDIDLCDTLAFESASDKIGIFENLDHLGHLTYRYLIILMYRSGYYRRVRVAVTDGVLDLEAVLLGVRDFEAELLGVRDLDGVPDLEAELLGVLELEGVLLGVTLGVPDLDGVPDLEAELLGVLELEGVLLAVILGVLDLEAVLLGVLLGVPDLEGVPETDRVPDLEGVPDFDGVTDGVPDTVPDRVGETDAELLGV